MGKDERKAKKRQKAKEKAKAKAEEHRAAQVLELVSSRRTAEEMCRFISDLQKRHEKLKLHDLEGSGTVTTKMEAVQSKLENLVRKKEESITKAIERQKETLGLKTEIMIMEAEAKIKAENQENLGIPFLGQVSLDYIESLIENQVEKTISAQVEALRAELKRLDESHLTLQATVHRNGKITEQLEKDMEELKLNIPYWH